MYRYRKTEKIRLKDRAVPGCVFCLDERQNTIIEESKLAFVMRSNFPYEVWEFRKVIDHLLIAPKRHVSSLAELTAEEKAEIMEFMARYEAKQYDVYARGLASVTRTVPTHQHTHLLKTADKPARAALYIDKPYYLRVV